MTREISVNREKNPDFISKKNSQLQWNRDTDDQKDYQLGEREIPVGVWTISHTVFLITRKNIYPYPNKSLPTGIRAIDDDLGFYSLI